MRIVAADGCALNAPMARSRGRLLLLLLAAGFIAFGLLGCAANDAEQAGSVSNARPHIPLPKRALLAPPKEPACDLTGPRANDGDGRTVAQAGSNAGLSQRIALEYERDCYQQAELRMRQRLLRLQAAVGSTMRAVRQLDRSAPN